MTLVNPFMSYGGAGALSYFYATMNGAGSDVDDDGGIAASGTFTVPSAWNGRKGRVSAGGRSSGTATSVTMSMSKGGSQFDGAGAGFYPSITGSPGGGTIHSAPIDLSTSDAFTFSGPVSGTDGSWSCIEVFPTTFSGALVNRTSTFSVGTALTDAEWNNEVYDIGGWFGANATQFIIPSGKSGLYRISCNMELTSPGTEMGLRIIGMAAGLEPEVDTATGPYLNIISPPIPLSTGAALSIQVRCQTATTMKVDENTWMAIEELDAALKYAIARWSSDSSAIPTGSSWTNVGASAEVADVGGWYAGPSDNKFTVPASVNRIRCGFFIHWTNTLGSAAVFGLFKNGVEHTLMPYNAQTNASREWCHAMSPIIEVSPGDTIEFYARTAAGSMGIRTGSFVWVEEVLTVT